MCKRSTSIIVAGLTLGGLLFIGSPAGAQSVYNLDQREDRQQQRIQQGVDSGALTPGEARRLEGEQARIQATEDRMRADGHLSPRERERLSQMQNRASRDIDRLKHNDRTAEGWGGQNYHGWGEHYNSGWDGNLAGVAMPMTPGWTAGRTVSNIVSSRGFTPGPWPLERPGILKENRAASRPPRTA